MSRRALTPSSSNSNKANKFIRNLISIKQLLTYFLHNNIKLKFYIVEDNLLLMHIKSLSRQNKSLIQISIHFNSNYYNTNKASNKVKQVIR